MSVSRAWLSMLWHDSAMVCRKYPTVSRQPTRRPTPILSAVMPMMPTTRNQQRLRGSSPVSFMATCSLFLMSVFPFLVLLRCGRLRESSPALPLSTAPLLGLLVLDTLSERFRLSTPTRLTGRITYGQAVLLCRPAWRSALRYLVEVRWCEPP